MLCLFLSSLSWPAQADLLILGSWQPPTHCPRGAARSLCCTPGSLGRRLGDQTGGLGCGTQHTQVAHGRQLRRSFAPSPLVCLFLQAEPGFVFHHANAYVEGGRITVDCVRYPRLPDFKGCRSDGHTFVQVSAHALCSSRQDCHVTLHLR